MKSKILTGMLLAATVMMVGVPAVYAEKDEVIDVQGIKFEVPEDVWTLVTFRDDDPDMVISVYETASIDAAKAKGTDYPGAGWLFGISAIPESEMQQLRCGGMDGMIPFAKDNDMYYIYCHPTDVRFVRETPEQMKEDQDEWTMLNEWATEAVRKEIVVNNPELDVVTYSDTELDTYLAKIAFQPGTEYAIRSFTYPDLDASSFTDTDYIDALTEDVYYEVVSDADAADGQYIVLAFDGDGVRFEFFENPDAANLIREVRTTDDGEEYVTYYEAHFEDEEDTAFGIIQEWCDAIAKGKTDD